jgi:histidinol phosphatase-like enzyme
MKLAVIDKDGTLTTPISGATFPQSPTDQQLLPGVTEAIDRLRRDGWTLAIASNQGGCDVFTVQASQVRIGNYVVHSKDDRYRVIEADSTSDDGLVFRYDRERINNYKSYSFSYPNSDVKVSYKTIESAIAELQFAADLCGIDQVYFCPDMGGQQCVILEKIQRYAFGIPTSNQWSQGICNLKDYRQELTVKNFRKPNDGMLQFALMDAEKEAIDETTDRIMIGDRPEDEAAALAAGFRFMDAEQWRNGASVEVVA